jgi:hypothetical protein
MVGMDKDQKKRSRTKAEKKPNKSVRADVWVSSDLKVYGRF